MSLCFLRDTKKHGNKEILNNLCWYGICQYYTIWTRHGDGEVTKIRVASHSDEVNVDMNDRLEDIIFDIREEAFRRAYV